MWCSEADINLLAEEKLTERYAKARTVQGTLQYHHFSAVPGRALGVTAANTTL